MTALRSLPDRAGLRRGRFRRLFNAFHDDRRGATAVEFAIVAPVFFFLIFLIAETAMIFIAEQVLDNAVFESARLVRTGQAQKSRMGQPISEPTYAAGCRFSSIARRAIRTSTLM